VIESEDAVAPAGDPVDTGVAPGASVGLCEDRGRDSNEGIAPKSGLLVVLVSL